MWPNEFCLFVIDLFGVSGVQSQAMVGMMALVSYFTCIVLIPAGVVGKLIERKVK